MTTTNLHPLAKGTQKAEVRYDLLIKHTGVILTTKKFSETSSLSKRIKSEGPGDKAA